MSITPATNESFEKTVGRGNENAIEQMPLGNNGYLFLVDHYSLRLSRKMRTVDK
jgi:hypothetical protein